MTGASAASTTSACRARSAERPLRAHRAAEATGPLSMSIYVHDEAVSMKLLYPDRYLAINLNVSPARKFFAHFAQETIIRFQDVTLSEA